MELTIITNDRNKGKTSYLARYVVENKVNGIISLSDNSKEFYSATRISDGESKVIMDINYPKKHRIGKFGIDTEAFKWAIEYLKSLVDDQVPIIALDEVGKLELYKRGYYKFLIYAKENYRGRLIITVRKEFVDEITELLDVAGLTVLNLL